MRGKNKNKWIITVLFLSAIFIAGFAMRLFFAINLEYENLHLGTAYTHDEYNYINMIRYFFSHGIYSYFSGAPDALVTPGYPIFLALIFSVFGSGDTGIFAVKVVQGVLSALSPLLIWWLVVQLTGKNKGGLLAAALFAVSPPVALYSRFILTETLYIFLMLVYVNFQIRAFKREGVKAHILAGVFFWAAIIVRPMAIVLAPVPYVWKMIATREWKKWLKLFCFFFLPTALLLLPWIIRNLLVLGQWIPLNSQTDPFYAGLWEEPSALPTENGGFISNIGLFFSLLFEKPLGMIKWFLYKKVNILFAWSAYWLPEGITWFVPLDNMINIFVKGTGALGLCYTLKNRSTRLFSVNLLCYMLMALLFVPNSRFGLQYLPFLCALSGIAVSVLMQKETS